MLEIVKSIIAIVFIIGLHYTLWKKIYKDLMGNLKGLAKTILFITCILIEATVTILIGIFFMNTTQ